MTIDDENSIGSLSRAIFTQVMAIARADFRIFSTDTLKRAFGEDYAHLPEGFEVIDYDNGESHVVNLRAKEKSDAAE